MTKRDLSTLTGLIVAISLICISLFYNSNLSKFANFPAFFLVFGCTIATSFASFSLENVLNAFKTSFHLIFFSPINPKEIAKDCIITAEALYKQSDIPNTKKFKKTISKNNPYFIRWYNFFLDGEKIEVIENLINDEIYSHQDQQLTVIKILKKASEIAPAFGLIGTLVGLVQMLSNIKDIENIGEGMSVALLTTFYGAILAYVIFLPISYKLEKNLDEEILNLRLIQRTIISLAKRENPRQIESTLNAILPPGMKIVYYKY